MKLPYRIYFKKCIICNGFFYSRQYNAKMCSDICRKRKQKNIAVSRICAYCGKLFYIKRHKYCSDICAEMSNLDYTRDNIAQKRKDPIIKSRMLGSLNTSEHYKMCRKKNHEPDFDREKAYIIWQKRKLDLM